MDTTLSRICTTRITGVVFTDSISAVKDCNLSASVVLNSVGLLRYRSFRFVAYSNDHLPRHVHAFFADAEVIIDSGVGPRSYDNPWHPHPSNRGNSSICAICKRQWTGPVSETAPGVMGEEDIHTVGSRFPFRFNVSL